MDSFSKTTLTRSSTIWNCARVFSFRVFRGRDEGDTCGCCFQKLVSMWFLIISVLVLVPCSYGSTLPVSTPAHYTNEWSHNQDSISYNYNNPSSNYRSGSVVSIPTYPVQRQQYINSFQATKSNHDHNQPEERVPILPEPKPRTDELTEKLGFSLPSLSSLLPTSILNLPQQSSDSENQIEADGNNGSPYLDDSELRQNPLPSQGSDNPGFTQEEQPNFEENGPYDSESSSTGSGLLSRIRNVLPFGKGFISGLLNNPDSNVENEGNEDGSVSGGVENGPNININQGPSAPNDSPLSDPNQVSITNEEDPDSGNSDSGDTSQAFPNPLRAMLNLLNLRPPALSDNKQSLDLPDLGSTNPLAQSGGDGDSTDSPITALQSLVDGAGDGVVGTGMSLLSAVTSAIGITSTNATWFILLGLALGPVIGTAIAASVIAIVYASIYIPAAAIRNEGLNGEFYVLTLKRLYEVLGIPDPLDELFDFGKRSYDGRALVRNDPSRKLAFLAGTAHDSEECMERAFCELVGRKLTGKQEGKRKWIAKGITWVADNILKNEKYLRSYSSSEIVRIGRLLLEAMSTGISSGTTTRLKRNTMAGNNTTESVSPDPVNGRKQNPCTKYVCDPLKSLRALFTKKKLDALTKPFKNNK
ncbi:unnamed protein product [Orchesella dallaii]|uniref:Uncharacterized protein n=1 Tax=Orchesella dallaii TaxID=48710 RepID=A0ABP1R9G3_9HEXA